MNDECSVARIGPSDFIPLLMERVTSLLRTPRRPCSLVVLSGDGGMGVYVSSSRRLHFYWPKRSEVCLVEQMWLWVWLGKTMLRPISRFEIKWGFNITDIYIIWKQAEKKRIQKKTELYYLKQILFYCNLTIPKKESKTEITASVQENESKHTTGKWTLFNNMDKTKQCACV